MSREGAEDTRVVIKMNAVLLDAVSLTTEWDRNAMLYVARRDRRDRRDIIQTKWAGLESNSGNSGNPLIVPALPI